jgi:hypothetical protein
MHWDVRLTKTTLSFLFAWHLWFHLGSRLDLCVARDRAGVMAFIEQHIMTSGEVVLQYLQRMEADQTA